METIKRDGNLILKDYDNTDDDEKTTNRLYCISYIDKKERQTDLMLVWRRGKNIRMRSVDGSRDCGYGSVRDILSFTNLLMEAQLLLGYK